MKDDEIIKALEHHASHTDECDNCPNAEISATECSRITAENALNLINRQNVEIERLQSMNQAKLDMIRDIRAELKTAKFEAIREFAEKLKYCVNYVHSPIGESVLYDAIETINSLVKEMTEEKL